MKLEVMGQAFPGECLQAAVLVSLLSVWALVGLFYYLNRHERLTHFNIWTGAWFFYALWLTVSLGMGDAPPGSFPFTINQACVSMSAILLLWGSLRCLGLPIPQKFSSIVAIFLAAWIIVSPQLMAESLQVHLPVFILLGLSSPFVGICFLRLQKQKEFVGVGMVSLGFLLWVIYLGNPHISGRLYSAGFLVAAALQLTIAICMGGLLLDENRRQSKKVQDEIQAVRQEQFNVVITKEACQHLYERMRATDESEKAMAEMRRAQRVAAERQELEALSQMAGDVAHDLNNALTPITAYSELLLSSLPNLPELPRQRLQKINDAAEDVAQIVAHMREFYRPGDPNLAAIEGNDSKQPRLDPDRPSANGGACRPLRILCIDDQEQLREVMNDVLESDHHNVTVASTGKAGLALFRANLRNSQPYDVVITDFGLPDIDGHHVARAIKAESPNTPIIMLTGWGTMVEGQSSLEVDAVLGKPPRKQEISNLLCQITERTA